MREAISNTSPLQYLHQVGLLHILPALTSRVIVPTAVANELEAGRKLGMALPDPGGFPRMERGNPVSLPVLPLITDLGPGETQVFALALETVDALAIIDHGPARRMAVALGIKLTGTLGLLIDAKKAGLIPAVVPVLELETLRFRIAGHTRDAVLRLSGELS